MDITRWSIPKSDWLYLELCKYFATKDGDALSVQFSHSVVSDSLQPHEAQYTRLPCPSPTPGVHPNHVHRVSESIQPSHPLLSPSPPALNFSHHQGIFQGVSSSHQVPNYWSFSFNISPSNEHPGLISFRMDWWDLLATKGLSRVFFNTTVQKHQFCAELCL